MRYLILTVFMFFVSTTNHVFANSYKLQRGDTIEISVWQDDKLNRQAVVRPDGRISVPLAGHLRAAGSSLEAVEARLKQRLQKFYSETLDVTVALIGRPEPQPAEEEIVEPTVLYITGEVRNPGRFAVTEPTTVLQALAISGGLGPFAAKKRIQIRRKVDENFVVMRFNYNDVESGRDLADNILLQEGDVIIVPEKGLFR